MPEGVQPVSFAIGFALSAAIGLMGYYGQSLSASGVLGAILVGTSVFAFGGWGWGLLLILFFVTSSLLSHYRMGQKANVAEQFAKTGRRDLGQALANGGVAALFALASPYADDRLPLYLAFAGSLAAVTADTWATELGILSRTPPRLITTGRSVPAGTSGAISPLGVVAALTGALIIALVALLLGTMDRSLLAGIDTLGLALILMILTISGLGGALVDSLLGATVQGIYWCPREGKETEKRIHSCGTPTVLRRGWAWLNNDWVNAICSGVGAVLAYLFWFLLTM
jgi:uncharacterized protein (TIGR00297 family)